MARNLSKGFYVAAILSITVVLSGRCHPCPTPQGVSAAPNEVSQVSHISQALIGKQITIRGKFSLRGKVGPYVSLDNQQRVYLQSKGSFTWGESYNEMEGKLVEATGTLKFAHFPDTKPAEKDKPQPEARVHDYYYFEMETAQVRLVSH